MPSWRKLRLALILIVDGVLIAKNQICRPTPKYVNMLEGIDSFLRFPLGRDSMAPAKKIPGKAEDPLVTFHQQLQQKTLQLQGFSLSLQLLAF